ncbi:ABC transporter permease [Bacillaceae bacterium W0354]
MKFKKWNYQLIFGTLFVSVLLIIAIVGPEINSLQESATERARAVINEDGSISKPPFPPGKDYLLGTDDFGISLLSKLLVGTREVFIFMIGITLIRFLIGIPLGYFSYYNNPLHSTINAWNKIFTYIPVIFTVIVVFNIPYIFYAPNRMVWMMFIIALIEVGRVALMYRSSIETIAVKPFITAAISTGTTRRRLFRKYYIPLTLPEIIVQMIIDFGRNMFLIGQLGIIGIYISYKVTWIPARYFELGGVHQEFQDAHSWPLLFRQLGTFIYTAPWIPLIASAAITVVVLGFLMFAEGLRKHFQKRQAYL